MIRFRGNPVYDLEARPSRWYTEVGAIAVWSLLAVVIALTVSCTVQRYAVYDYWTDKTITDLHYQTMKMLDTAAGEFQDSTKTTINTAAGEFQDSTKTTINRDSFYIMAYATLETLIIRASTIENNQETLANLEGLVDSFKIVEELHQDGFASLAQVRSLTTSLNSHFRALLFLEQAKKRGAHWQI